MTHENRTRRDRISRLPKVKTYAPDRETAESCGALSKILGSHADTSQTCHSVAEILGSQDGGALFRQAGGVLLFVPDAASMEHIRAAAEFIQNLCTAMDGADSGGT
jgi:hypothetical protein